MAFAIKIGKKKNGELMERREMDWKWGMSGREERGGGGGKGNSVRKQGRDI